MTDVHIRLTGVTQRRTDTFAALPYVSKDGKQAFLNYQLTYNPASPTNIGWELFNTRQYNFNTTTNVQSADPVFINVDGGQASDDFTLFSFLDDNYDGSSNYSQGRIRIARPNASGGFDILATRVVGVNPADPYFGVGFSLNGGNFSSDNQYVTLSYVYNPNLGQPYQLSILRILNVSDLSDAVSPFYFNGATSGAYFLTLRQKGQESIFVEFTSFAGTFDADLGVSLQAPPFLLNIYELTSNGLVEVLQKDNVYGSSFVIRKDKKTALFSLTVVQENPPLSVFVPAAGSIAANILEVVLFDGKKLHSVARRTFANGASALIHPSEQYLYGQGGAVNYSYDYGYFLRFVDTGKAIVIKNATADFTIESIRPAAAFSGNGKVLVVAASDTPFYDGTVVDCAAVGTNPIYNLNFYRVHVELCVENKKKKKSKKHYKCDSSASESCDCSSASEDSCGCEDHEYKSCSSSSSDDSSVSTSSLSSRSSSSCGCGK